MTTEPVEITEIVDPFDTTGLPPEVFEHLNKVCEHIQKLFVAEKLTHQEALLVVGMIFMDVTGDLSADCKHAVVHMFANKTHGFIDHHANRVKH
jgi:hypothetical protein